MFLLKNRAVYLLYLLIIGYSLGIATTAIAQTTQQYTCADITEISQDECSVLQDLYDVGVINGMFQSNTPCSWVYYYNGNTFIIIECDPSTNTLITLNIYSNEEYDLTTLPESLGNLTNLTTLKIYDNDRLTTLPDSLGNLINLTALTVSENRSIFTLPDSIGNLTNLMTLYLSGNLNLSTLPESIGDLENLETLYLSRNWSINTLPESVGNLTNLTSLIIRENVDFTTLPDSLINLTNLEELRIESNNSLINLPENFKLSAYSHLTSFYVQGYEPSSCLDSHSSKECQALQALFDVNVGNETWYTNFDPCTWDYISCWLPGKITHLRINDTELMELPDEMKDLDNLKYLSITDTPIQNLSFIGELTTLETLRLDSLNNIVMIPSSIGLLENLKVLEILNLDRVMMIPEAIANLQSLEGLAIQDNDLLQYISPSITEEIFPEIVNSRDRWEGYPTENAMVYGYYDVQSIDIEPIIDVEDASFLFLDNDGISHIRLTPDGEDEQLTFTFDSFTCRYPTDVFLVSNYTNIPMNQVDGKDIYTVSLLAPSELGGDAPYDISIKYNCIANVNPFLFSAAQIYLYEPNGIVTDLSGSPIEGAYVTLFNKEGLLPDTADTTNDCRTADTRMGDSWTSLPSAELSGADLYDEEGTVYPQTNIQITGSDGEYAWDIADGCWYVSVSAEGYESVVSPLVGTSSTLLDLDLRMQSIVLEEKIPTSINTLIYDDNSPAKLIIGVLVIGWFSALLGAFIYLQKKYGFRME